MCYVHIPLSHSSVLFNENIIVASCTRVVELGLDFIS